eukprot:1941415-Pleurochrysis_carterae.AAC.3
MRVSAPSIPKCNASCACKKEETADKQTVQNEHTQTCDEYEEAQHKTDALLRKVESLLQQREKELAKAREALATLRAESNRSRQESQLAAALQRQGGACSKSCSHARAKAHGCCAA